MNVNARPRRRNEGSRSHHPCFRYAHTCTHFFFPHLKSKCLDAWQSFYVIPRGSKCVNIRWLLWKHPKVFNLETEAQPEAIIFNGMKIPKLFFQLAADIDDISIKYKIKFKKNIQPSAISAAVWLTVFFPCATTLFISVAGQQAVMVCPRNGCLRKSPLQPSY